MKLSFITPTAFIHKFGAQGDFIMALSHLLDIEKVNKYEKAVLKTKLPIFLDNGCFEKGSPEGADKLLAKAIRIKAELVFAPDYLFQAEETRKSVDIFIGIKEKLNIKIKVAAIPQAGSKKEYLELYKYFNEHSKIDAIGISFLAVSEALRYKSKRKGDYEEKLNPLKFTEDRIKMLREIDLRFKKHKPVHLLGLGNSYKDVITAPSWVESNDTSCCFQSGLFGKKLTEELEVKGGKVKEKVDFDLKKITQDQLNLIQNNINKVKEKI